MADDPEALELMFRQFLPASETIRRCAYLGLLGLWGIGTKSFACLTDRRLCGLRVGLFGEVVYQDGYLEYVNSSVVYQPSRFGLFILLAFFSSLGAFLCVITQAQYERLSRYHAFDLVDSLDFTDYALLAILLFLTPLSFPLLWLIAVKLFYGFKKCGVVHCIREGVNVYWFTNRSKLARANEIFREGTKARLDQLAALPPNARP
ncbi:MAG: hypothetical protein ACKV19_00140 [Verrucomicrobiales bacterium]